MSCRAGTRVVATANAAAPPAERLSAGTGDQWQEIVADRRPRAEDEQKRRLAQQPLSLLTGEDSSGTARHGEGGRGAMGELRGGGAGGRQLRRGGLVDPVPSGVDLGAQRGGGRRGQGF